MMLPSGFPFVGKAYDIVWRTVQNTAQLFQGQHGDIPALFQGIQRLVVDPLLEQSILADLSALHRCP